MRKDTCKCGAPLSGKATRCAPCQRAYLKNYRDRKAKKKEPLFKKGDKCRVVLEDGSTTTATWGVDVYEPLLFKFTPYEAPSVKPVTEGEGE